MKYITIYFTSFFSITVVIASFNWFIDPFGMFWSPTIENINLIKPEAGKRARITKAYQVHKIKPEILIVGNSRVEMGLSPLHSTFSEKVVYNQGMPGASVAMQVDYALDALIQNNSIETILIGVDFLDFLLTTAQFHQLNALATSHKMQPYSFRLSSSSSAHSDKLLRWKEKLSMVFSLDALNASTMTVLKQKNLSNSINENGFNNALSYINIINTEGLKPLFSQKLSEISKKLNKESLQVLTQVEYPYSPVFQQLGRLIDYANNNKVNIVFFINPYHSSYLHTIADNHQWENFKLWKTTLVHYISSASPSLPIKIWDFSHFSDFTSEVVPPLNSKTQMQWYWEPAHYRKSLGNLMINKMYATAGVQPRFGQLLSVGNIATTTTKDDVELKNTLINWQQLKEKLAIQ